MEFFPNNANFMSDIGRLGDEFPNPSSFFGKRYGREALHYEEIITYLETLVGLSPCAEFREYGRSHGGRRLVQIVISSEENLNNLERIQAARAKLWQGAGLEGDETDLPPVVILGNNIHGDECSGSEAALALTHMLLASEGDVCRDMLKNLIIVIDPVENPDGRERILAQQAAYRGLVPNPDQETLSNAGVWPGGRGNHYFVDLNRDVLAQSQPESRARTRTMVEWMPQVVVDVHEMEAGDTYLFACPAEPLNPHIPNHIHKWWDRFAGGLGAGFDALGQGYYRGEWNEVFFPGYADIWPVYHGALTLLFEQSTTCGRDVMKPNGRIVTYREAIRNQLSGFWSVLKTAQEGREELMADWAAFRWQARKEGQGRASFLVCDHNDHLLNRMAGVLLNQGVEIHVSTQQTVQDGRTLPVGSLMVRRDQPAGRLVRNLLDSNVPMTDGFLEEDHATLQGGGESQLYDISGWSLPLLYNIDVFEAPACKGAEWEELIEPRKLLVAYIRQEPRYGFLCRDPELHLTGALLQAGVSLRVGSTAFKYDKRQYERGTFLLRREDNGGNIPEVFHRIATEKNIEIIPVEGALSQEGVDLGGQTFKLLIAPRIAMLAGEGVSVTAFGSCWHLLDHDVGVCLSHFTPGRVTPLNLRRHNVLILPHTETFRLLAHENLEPRDYDDIISKQGHRALKEWVMAGGTLVTMGDSATYMAGAYCENQAEPKDVFPTRYMSKGAILKGELNDAHWLCYGNSGELPVLFNGKEGLELDAFCEIAVRFGPAESLALSGVLWPEAADALAGTPYLARRQMGLGQVIFFAADPNFRLYTQALSRLFLNAVILGPGLGCQRPWPTGVG